MNSSRIRTKLAAIVLAAGLGTLVPAPAIAQQTSDQTQDRAPWEPPPVDMSQPLPTTGIPQSNVSPAPETQCVTSMQSTFRLEDIPWGQQQLGIGKVHDLGFRGAGMTVAVIDTGVNNRTDWLNSTGIGDYVHPASDGNEDCDGHGTMVAGIIAGHPTDSDVGFVGVAPDAKILSIRQSSANYTTTVNGKKKGAGDLPTLAAAIKQAADRDDVSVINISIDLCRKASDPMSTAEKILQRTLEYAVVARNKVVVNSAGNIEQNTPCTTAANGTNPQKPDNIEVPAWFSDYVLSVAAVDRTGNPADFSVQGPWISVAAPGTDIISLDPGNPRSLANQMFENGKPGAIQGTSFAAPYVAGLATLVREKFPKLSALEVKHRIEYTAQHPGTPTGRDNYVGYGMINPMAALTATVPSELGIAPAKAVSLPPGLPAVVAKDWTPMLVALIGSGSGLVLLAITMFTMHTIRRNRRVPEPVRRNSA